MRSRNVNPTVEKFLFPEINRWLLLRIGLIVVICYVVFSSLLIPLRVQGQSMEPTYADNSFAFSWCLQYLFADIQRYDVVTVRFAGKRVMLLKRVVALPGETVAFHRGILYVNAKPLPEPYVRYTSDWELAERRVAPGHVYVVGDNRSKDINRHRFGQVRIERIIGGVIP